MCSSISSRFQSRLVIGLLAGLFSLIAVLPLHAEFIDGEQKLVPADGAAGKEFGDSVSISGNYAIVGAISDDDKGNSSGSVYIFRRNSDDSWTQQTKLTANDGVANDKFGRSVSISGDYAIVGADGDGYKSGSAYIFRRDPYGSWIQQKKLIAKGATAGELFGNSVSISGDYAIVGAIGPLGSAYIFRRNSDDSWTQEKKLTADEDAEESFGFFGGSVSISGDYAIVGAGGENLSSGAAYIFRRNSDGSWTQQEKLLANDGAVWDIFGSSVSISGDYAIVGACSDDYNGSAYIFRRNFDGSWTQQKKLIANNVAESDGFGNSVSISGDFAIVGALYDDGQGSDFGVAYIFRRSSDGSWIQHRKLTSDDGAEGDQFGGSVSISGDYIIVGTGKDDDKGINSGSAYIYNTSLPYKINSSDGAEGDNFGDSVSISGDYAIVGAGSAYIFRRNSDDSWTQQEKLFANEGAAGDRFGGSVSISGDYTIVGSNSGYVYIFKRSSEGSWIQQEKLMAKDGDVMDWFGNSVSIFGDYAIVGALGEGAAYIFRRNLEGSWSQQIKFTASDGAAMDWFGNSVSIFGDYAIVGSYRDDDRGSDAGAVYLFRRDLEDSWIYQAKLFADDGTMYDQFGGSVSIFGDYILVAAYEEDGVSDGVYIFRRNFEGSWIQQAKLFSDDGAVRDYFGYSVSTSDKYAIVGAFLDDDKGFDSGSVYIFRQNSDGSLIQQAKLTANDGAECDYFGWSVSVSGDYAIVGASGDDNKGRYSGSSYIFKAPFNVNSNIAITAAGKGSVSPGGIFTLGLGQSQEFRFSSDPCHKVSDVLVDGKSVGAVSSYTFSDILTDHTLEAVFEIQTFTVTIKKAGKGYGEMSQNTQTHNSKFHKRV